jgi:2-polyprenyl-3-methyl-5-hydroxy-6-metoxy-1,4-benzoquinol methylase
MQWKEFWDQFPAKFKDTDFLRQVGKTVGGQPISAEQFGRLIQDIHNALELDSQDRVLDLCCGNGVITSAVASSCASILGVDYSAPLIDVARKHNKPANAEYFCASVLDSGLKRVARGPYTKVYMYEALQHFKESDLPILLNLLRDVTSPRAIMLLASVPDADRLWDFYDTPERQADYRKRMSENREAIGTWWKKEKISQIASEHGLDATFLAQNPILHTAHYRFDVRLTWRPSESLVRSSRTTPRAGARNVAP